MYVGYQFNFIKFSIKNSRSFVFKKNNRYLKKSIKMPGEAQNLFSFMLAFKIKLYITMKKFFLLARVCCLVEEALARMYTLFLLNVEPQCKQKVIIF